MSKYQQWYDSSPEHTKTYLKNQPLWHDRDLFRAGLVGVTVGLVVGIVIGYEWAWRPVVNTFRPLVG